MKLRIPESSYRLVVLAAILNGLGGCHDSSGGNSQVADPPVASPPPSSGSPGLSEAATHGYFVGDIQGVYGEALLTVDGLVRIYVDGIPGSSDTLGSRQFVGHLEFADGEASGSGLVYTQGCDRRGESTVGCGGAVPADVSIATATRGALLGEIMLADGEVWSIGMYWPSVTYLDPATLEYVLGQYTEWKAEAASGAIINVDGAGELFFQSPESGCIGNGSLAPHGDGMLNVYDITLVVDNCASGYEASNGEFEGLATRTIDDWSGDWLVAWVSTVDTVPLLQAIVMWGSKN